MWRQWLSIQWDNRNLWGEISLITLAIKCRNSLLHYGWVFHTQCSHTELPSINYTALVSKLLNNMLHNNKKKQTKIINNILTLPSPLYSPYKGKPRIRIFKHSLVLDFIFLLTQKSDSVIFWNAANHTTLTCVIVMYFFCVGVDGWNIHLSKNEFFTIFIKHYSYNFCVFVTPNFQLRCFDI